MIFEKSVTVSRTLFHEGAEYPKKSRQLSVLDAYRELRHACEYGPTTIDRTDPTEIVFSKHFPEDHHLRLSMSIPDKDGREKRVFAEREEYSLVGSRQALRPLLVFLSLYWDGEGAPTLTEVEIGSEFETPSWVPALILSQRGLLNAPSNAKKREILAKYGLDEHMLEQVRKARVVGIMCHIAAATELWFNHPEKQFGELLPLALEEQEYS